MPPETPADASDFQRVSGATDQQMADLTKYRALLVDWNARMNLVGANSLPAFWTRHALDSWQLLSAAPGALRWADLGSGAGLPGIVLAIALKGRLGAEVHLVESLAKRCRFLTAVVETLAVPARIHNARAESFSTPCDVVTARACAPLDRLFGFAEPWLRQGAIGLFLKGEAVDAELIAARQHWMFHVELSPSISDPRGHLVRIERLAPREP
jgi:16S rRNA (guanine527-N7)-methyltransferase